MFPFTQRTNDRELVGNFEYERTHKMHFKLNYKKIKLPLFPLPKCVTNYNLNTSGYRKREKSRKKRKFNALELVKDTQDIHVYVPMIKANHENFQRYHDSRNREKERSHFHVIRSLLD